MFEFTEKKQDRAIHVGRGAYVVASAITAILPISVVTSRQNAPFAVGAIHEVKAWLLVGDQMVPAYDDVDTIISRWSGKDSDR